MFRTSPNRVGVMQRSRFKFSVSSFTFFYSNSKYKGRPPVVPVFVEKPLCLSEFQLNETANLYSTQFCVSVLKTQHNYKVMHRNFKSKGRPGNLTRKPYLESM